MKGQIAALGAEYISELVVVDLNFAWRQRVPTGVMVGTGLEKGLRS
jgi:hypothetical protein